MADTDEIGTSDLASGAVGAAVDVGDNAGDAGHRPMWLKTAVRLVGQQGQAVGLGRTKSD